MQYSQLQRAMAAGVRIFEVLDLEPDVNDKPDAIELPEIDGEIKYNDVTFHYIPGTDVLKSVNLHIKARRERGAGGIYRSGQEHVGESAAPFGRCHRRIDNH